MSDLNQFVNDVVAAPLGDVIASVGEGVAEAQRALDDASLAQTLAIYDDHGDETAALLREIGYRPTFYALPETTGEVRVSLALGPGVGGSSGTSAGGRVRPRLYATPVDASYGNRYSFEANVAAKLTFKIVPVPPPDALEGLRVVPDVTEWLLADAIERLALLNLQASVVDSDGKPVDEPAGQPKVERQEPAPGQVAREDEPVLLVLA